MVKRSKNRSAFAERFLRLSENLQVFRQKACSLLRA